MRSSLFAPVGALVLAGYLAPAPTWAQPAQPSPATVDAARGSFRRGVEFLNARRFADALLAFEASYRMNPVPIVLMNMGIAHQGLHHNAEAVEYLERYLRDANTQVPPDRVREVRTTIDDLRRGLATIQLSIRPDVFTVTVDGENRTVLASAVLVNPGHHVVTVSAPQRRELRREFDLVSGGSVIVDAALEPEGSAPTTDTPHVAEVAPTRVAPPEAAAPQRSPDPRVALEPPRRDAPAVSTPIYRRWWFWTLIGVGVAGATTAVVFGLQQTQQPVEGVGFTASAIQFR